MSESSSQKSFEQLSESDFPVCLHCGKPVESLIVSPNQHNKEMVTVEYRCHGESVRQDVPASVLTQGRGLAAYTAFNDFTSGLIPHNQS